MMGLVLEEAIATLCTFVMWNIRFVKNLRRCTIVISHQEAEAEVQVEALRDGSNVPVLAVALEIVDVEAAKVVAEAVVVKIVVHVPLPRKKVEVVDVAALPPRLKKTREKLSHEFAAVS